MTRSLVDLFFQLGAIKPLQKRMLPIGAIYIYFVVFCAIFAKKKIKRLKVKREQGKDVK